MPKATLYRIARDLRDANEIGQDGEGAPHYLLQAGRDRLARVRGEPAHEGARPQLPQPHLALAPTALHRAVLELVLCSVVMRHSGLREKSHAAFVLIGPGMRFKTWVAEAAALMCGIDPRAGGVLYLPRETAKGLTERHDARGNTVTVRGALAQKVVGFDEFARAKPEVRKEVELYLHGKVEVPTESGEPLRIFATPILTMNPPEKVRRRGRAGGSAPTLEERTLLDPAMLRRSIVLDLENVAMQDLRKVRREGDRLEEVRELGAVTLPPPQNPDFDPREVLDELLTDVLDSEERFNQIDVGLVAQLATGATAWLGDRDALALVAWNYCEIVEQLGWLKADWRRRIEAHLRDVNLASPAEDLVDARPPAGEANPFDLEADLLALDDALRQLNLTPQAAAERLRLLGELHEAGFASEDVEALARALSAAGSDPERLCALVVEHGDVARAIEAERARVAAEHKGLERERTKTEARLASLQASVERAKRELERSRAEQAQVARRLERLRAEAAPLAEESGRVAIQRAALDERREGLEAAAEQLARAAAAARTRREDLDRREAEVVEREQLLAQATASARTALEAELAAAREREAAVVERAEAAERALKKARRRFALARAERDEALARLTERDPFWALSSAELPGDDAGADDDEDPDYETL